MIAFFYGLQFYFLNYFLAFFPSHVFRNFVLKLMGMKIGRCVAIYGKFELRNPWNIVIGNNSSIGHKATLDGRGGLIIGNNVNISSEVMVWTWQHDYNSPTFDIVSKPVIIEDYAWVSARVIILPGVKVAEGSVIAAGAVVTRDTEPYYIYAGIPARKVKERNKIINYNPVESIIPFI